LHLPKDLRRQLKNPLGSLIKDSNLNKETVLNKIHTDSFIITVGDKTTEKMLELGLKPQIQIIDGYTGRDATIDPLEERDQCIVSSDDAINTKLSCKNPPGEITEESIQVIQKAFSSEPPVRITVDGEEDLLVIPVCIHAPENSVVMYGQPNEGLVIVTITPEIRAKVRKILDVMN